jgi:hypothetical protein
MLGLEAERPTTAVVDDKWPKSLPDRWTATGITTASVSPGRGLQFVLSCYCNKYIYLSISGPKTAVAFFRNPNTIPFCLTTDQLLNVLFPWLLIHLPSTFFLDVLFFFFLLIAISNFRNFLLTGTLIRTVTYRRNYLAFLLFC